MTDPLSSIVREACRLSARVTEGGIVEVLYGARPPRAHSRTMRAGDRRWSPSRCPISNGADARSRTSRAVVRPDRLPPCALPNPPLQTDGRVGRFAPLAPAAERQYRCADRDDDTRSNTRRARLHWRADRGGSLVYGVWIPRSFETGYTSQEEWTTNWSFAEAGVVVPRCSEAMRTTSVSHDCSTRERRRRGSARSSFIRSGPGEAWAVAPRVVRT